MSLELIAQIADEYDISPEMARKIFITFSDQPELPRLMPLQAAPGGGEVQEEPGRPPAREVDPWWIISGIWQILEPTVAWPSSMLLSSYEVAKLAMAVKNGLP